MLISCVVGIRRRLRQPSVVGEATRAAALTFLREGKCYKREDKLIIAGIMGVVVGDALGVPVEFFSQERLTARPVEGMLGYGTNNLSAGSRSDDSSMTLATLDSLQNGYDLRDIMDKFVDWYENGTVSERVQTGLDEGFAYYEQEPESAAELVHYSRIRDVEALKAILREEIKGSGYVVPTLEAVLWSLVRSESFARREWIEGLCLNYWVK